MLAPEDVWVPDVVVYSLIDSKQPGIESITVNADGSTRWLSQKVITVGCSFLLDAFPFDTQTCNFTLGSNSHVGHVLDVRPRVADKSSYKAVGVEGSASTDEALIADGAALDLSNYWYSEEFALVKARIIAHERFYSCCPEAPYPEIIFDLHLTRMASTYVTGIIVPLIVATAVSLGTLLMPAPTSGSRPALNVSIMFTTTAIYFVADHKLPDINRLTLISRLYVATLIINLVLVLISVVATALNLIAQESTRMSAEAMQRYLFYDKDKNGSLDEEEIRAAMCTLGIGDEATQDLLFRKAGVTQAALESEGISPMQWRRITTDVMAHRPTVHYSIVLGPFYAWLARRGEGMLQAARSQEVRSASKQGRAVALSSRPDGALATTKQTGARRV